MRFVKVLTQLIIIIVITDLFYWAVGDNRLLGIPYHFTLIQLAANLFQVLVTIGAFSILLDDQVTSHLTSIVTRLDKRSQLISHILRISLLIASLQACIQLLCQAFSTELRLSTIGYSLIALAISWAFMGIIFSIFLFRYGTSLAYLITLGIYLGSLYLGSGLGKTKLNIVFTLQFVNLARLYPAQLGAIIIIGALELVVVTILFKKLLSTYDFLER